MRTILYFAFACTMIACGKSTSKEQKTLDTALGAYKKNPTDETSKAFASAYNAYVDIHGYADPALPRYMLEGARLAEDRQKLNSSLSWYESYFTRFQDDPNIADHLFEMTTLIEKFGKPELSQVFYKSFVNRFPSHAGAATLRARITDPSISVDSSLQFVIKSIPNYSENNVNTDLLQLYIEMVEVSVMTDPTLSLGFEHLIKGAEMARLGKIYPRAIKLYDWVMRFYPTKTNSTSSIFMKGYITYFDLKNYDKANAYFKEYQTKDPYGQFEIETNYLLNNPGKTEAEVKNALEGKG